MPNAAERLLQFRKLTDLSIQTPSGMQVHLSEFPVRHVLFSPSAPPEGPSSTGIDIEDIFLSGSPTTPFALLSLFHELGHRTRLAHMTKEERRDYSAKRRSFGWQISAYPLLTNEKREKRFEESAEEVLRDERGAWAVALSKLRPFLPLLGVSREDALKGVHEISLASYSDKTRERLAREPQLSKLIESLSAIFTSTDSAVAAK